MIQKKFKPLTPVMVRWFDAAAPQHGWGAIEESYSPGDATTLGLVVGNDKIAITVAPSMISLNGRLEAISDPIVLPWGMIQSIKEVQIVATKTTKKKVAKKTTKKK